MAARGRRRDSDSGDDGVAWEELQAEAVGVFTATTFPEMLEEKRKFRRRLDAKYGPGAADEVATKVVRTSGVYARLLGLSPEEAAKKGASTWTLGRGYHYSPPDDAGDGDEGGAAPEG